MVWVFHSFVKSQFMCIGRHRLQVSIDFFQANMPHQHSPGKWDRKYESLQIRESHTRVCVCGWSWCMPANRGQGPGLIGLLMACCKALLLFSLCTDIPHAFMCLEKKPKCHHYKKHHQHENSNICQNIKQMPKKQSCFQLKGRVRECTVPKPGHRFQNFLLSINNFLCAPRSLYLCFFLFGGGI